MALGAYQVSDDGAWLAYSFDDTGFRHYTLRIKDLRSGRTLPISVERVTSAAWAADNATLFYTVEDETTKRSHRLYRQRQGTDIHDLIYEEPDEAFNIAVGRTRSLAYLILGIGSLTTSEARYLPAAEPSGEWRLLAPRVHDQEYEVDHRDDVFYVRVNDTGRNFRLVTAPVDSPGRDSWREVVPHRAQVMLEGIDLFKNHCVLLEREDGLPQLSVTDLRTRESHRVAFPEPAYSVFPGTNAEWDTNSYRYTYQSLTTPSSVLDYDMSTRVATLLKEQPVLGGYDRTRYECERLYATAPDGVRVPLSVVYRKGARRGAAGLHPHRIWILRPAPSDQLFLEPSLPPRSRPGRGARPPPRGRRDGQAVARRRPSAEEAEHLHRLHRRAPSTWWPRLHDAGPPRDRGRQRRRPALGAVVNMRPDLFRAVVSKVPFVDVINTMLDASLPLTVGEYEEWGNPAEKRRVRLHQDLLSLYEPRDEALPRHACEDVVQRQPGDVLGAREVRGSACGRSRRTAALLAQDQHGGGARRSLGPLRLPARGRLRLRRSC